MSENSAPFYITTAISYPNGRPHIGHAYTAIATDVLARFARADGKDVFALAGRGTHSHLIVNSESGRLADTDFAATDQTNHHVLGHTG